ncbi:hypothetical protein MPH_12912, partial [Macrophomina phaseolina MS6]
PLVDCPAS